jgi:hypothetical protein
MREPEGAHLQQRHRIAPAAAGGDDPAVAVSPKRGGRRRRNPRRRPRRLAGGPAEGVQQRQVNAAPGRRLRGLGADPLGRGLTVALLQERHDLTERPERPADQGRQDRVPQQGEGLVAALPGDVGAGQALPPALGAVIQPGPQEQAIGAGPGGGGVPEGDLEGQVHRQQPQLGHPRHQILHYRARRAVVDSHASMSPRYCVRSGSKSRVWPAPG